MPKYSHVVWDWNGTLLDDAEFCVRIMNRMLCKRSLPPITMDFYRSVIEFPVEGYYRKLGFDFEKETFEDVSDEYVSHYQTGWRGCPLHEGVREALAALKAAGVGQSVLSASKSAYLTEQLDHFGISALMDAVTGADNHHGRGKLALAREHAQALGAEPSRVVFIGDTEHDAEVSREAGCACLLVTFGHYSPQRLRHLGVPVAGSMPEIVNNII